MSASPPSALELALFRIFAWLWRFKSLALAEYVFRNVTEPLIVRRNFCGFTLCLDAARSNAQRLLYLEGFRHVGERSLLQSLIRPGDRIIDVGANIGYYALMFRQWVGESGSILCLEPEPSNLAELKRNIAANQLSNIQVVKAAAGAHDGEISFAAGLNGQVSAEGLLKVAVVRLDSVGEEKTDFLKIDVEGFEFSVLEGARAILSRDAPALFLEMHPHLLGPHTHREIVALLREYYRELHFHEQVEPRGSLAKFALRYAGKPEVQEVRNPEALLAECEAGRRQRTFWVTAERGGGIVQR